MGYIGIISYRYNIMHKGLTNAIIVTGKIEDAKIKRKHIIGKKYFFLANL